MVLGFRFIVSVEPILSLARSPQSLLCLLVCPYNKIVTRIRFDNLSLFPSDRIALHASSNKVICNCFRVIKLYFANFVSNSDSMR